MYRLSFAGAIAAALISTVPSQARTLVATWYGLHDHSGPRTADGTRFSAYDPTICAAPPGSWSFGTRLRLQNTHNGRVAYCTVHDLGPFVKGKELDVTYGLKEVLGMGDIGILQVDRIP